MGLKIQNLTLKHFRAFRELHISDLGRVNLITGKNNTGKSSVLEALHLLAHGATSDVISHILERREENIEVEGEGRVADWERLLHISTLFHGFPEPSDIVDPIVISINDNSFPMRLTIQIGWFSEERDTDGNLRLVPLQADAFDAPEDIAALVIEMENEKKRILALERLERYSYRRRLLAPGSETRMSSNLVSPYDDRTAILASLWDRVALTKFEHHIVEALQIIEPRILAVNIIGAERSRSYRGRTTIVRIENIGRPVPLQLLGDGVNRLLDIALSLVNARGGLLLIDEFENGLHHTVQFDAWKTIFLLAKELDIQVFATSHSWDAVEAFQQAAAETPEEGALVRLTRKGEEIIPTVFAKDELAIVTRNRIEVR